MNDYKVLKRLGTGSQGSVHLVEHTSSGVQYVMKKIECSDEAEATKANKEAQALQSLQHSSVCRYKDVFLSWDREDESMYVCIVMQYCRHGDLDRALRARRSKREHIEEHVVRKWLGQLVETLVFIHDNNVIHRDLKPSNIFITKELNLLIGDFGVSTIMEDVRAITRSAVGSVNWIAPEILEAQAPKYDERSDVWSLGCIVLDMITCGLLPQTALSGILFQIKLNPKVLNDLVTQLLKVYSAGLCELVQIMLRRSYQQRPTARALLKHAEVQECLRLSGSSLSEPPEEDGLGLAQAPLCPRNGDAGEVYGYLAANLGSRYCVSQALQCLLELRPHHSPAMCRPEQLLRAMEGHPRSDVHALALDLLGAHHPPGQPGRAGPGLPGGPTTTTGAHHPPGQPGDAVLTACVASMQEHGECLKVQRYGLSLLTAVQDSSLTESQQGDVVKVVLAALAAFAQDSQVAAHSFMVLSVLATHKSCRLLMRELGGVVQTSSVLSSHSSSKTVTGAALSLLWSLSVEDACVEQMLQAGVLDQAVEALRDFAKESSVVQYGCALLASLVEGSETTAFLVMHTQGGVEGIPVIMDAIKAHRENTAVLAHALTLLQQMAVYKDVCGELISYKMVHFLQDLADQYGSSDHHQPTRDGLSDLLTKLAV